MKTFGLIGGIGPESTIEYYRWIIAGYTERRPSDGYPSIVINSVNLPKLLALLNANQLGEFTDILTREIERLAGAGADFAAFAANTPHLVFDELQKRSRIPLISIMQATREKVEQMGMKKVGLLGTRFTMQGRFYPEEFSRANIQMVVPTDEQQNRLHEKYIGELLNNVFAPATREEVLKMVDDLIDEHQIEAVILAGTELPLLLKAEERNGLPLLDTTRIHVDRIVTELCS